MYFKKTEFNKNIVYCSINDVKSKYIYLPILRKILYKICQNN